MEAMSYCLGIEHYIYYNKPIPRNIVKNKRKIPTEIRNLKRCNIGEKIE